MRTTARRWAQVTLATVVGFVPSAIAQSPVVDTGQTACYDDVGEIVCPRRGQAFYGQDGQHAGRPPAYHDNGDGTVTDLNTGLMWQQGYAEDKLTYTEALAYVQEMNARHLAGYGDWRLPSIKQLYSLIDFRGTDPRPEQTGNDGLAPFIDTEVFDFAYGDLAAGERIIDSQWATTTLYTANPDLMFGVNFADGRIKAYPVGATGPFREEKTFCVRLCRGNPGYGSNHFLDNGDGTVTDEATGLMWSTMDSGVGMTWREALAFVEGEDSESYLGYDDWRLPDAKELHSILDYTRSPDTTVSAAIDPVFDATAHQRSRPARLPVLLDQHHVPAPRRLGLGRRVPGFRPRPRLRVLPVRRRPRRRLSTQ